MIELADIPPLRGPRPEGAERVRRRGVVEGAVPVRRSVLGGLVAAGGSLGLTALGVFPPVRQALASGYSLAAAGYYEIYQGCPSYATNHNCSPGCGPSLVCSTCCRTSGKYKGFHKSGVSDPGKYKLRPNQCYAGKYDGWRWAYSHKCGNCAKGLAWRCHDGWKKNSSGSWFRTICRTRVACYN